MCIKVRAHILYVIHRGISEKTRVRHRHGTCGKHVARQVRSREKDSRRLFCRRRTSDMQYVALRILARRSAQRKHHGGHGDEENTDHRFWVCSEDASGIRSRFVAKNIEHDRERSPGLVRRRVADEASRRKTETYQLFESGDERQRISVV